MKNYMLVAATLTMGTLGFSQTLTDALKKTDNELYESATKDFKSLIAKEPTKPENYFFLGENYLKRDMLDSAKYYWNKAATVTPATPFTNVAAGKVLWYNSDTAAANVKFKDACTQTKHKNGEIMRQIAVTYISAPLKDLNKAIKLSSDAIKLEPKNTEGYLIYGDALFEKTPGDASKPIAEYKKALEIDPKLCKALLRKALIYKRSGNAEEALSIFEEIIALDNTYAPVYREKAEVQMKKGLLKEAVETWKKYLALNNSNEARYRYAIALYTGGNFCEAVKELEYQHSIGTRNMYTLRMLSISMYYCNPAKDVTINEKGLKLSDEFFTMAQKKDIYVQDYTNRANHLTGMGKDSLAILELYKAIETDERAKNECLSQIAKLEVKNKNYNGAIKAYTMKMDGDMNKLDAGEHYELARAYYFGPQNYALADSSFKRLLSPNYPSGYLWHARCLYKLETPETKWAAQAPYQQFLESLKPEDKTNPNYKSTQIEAAKYMGDYYVNSSAKDFTKAKVYWKMVQDLDPADAQAKAFFASPAGK